MAAIARASLSWCIFLCACRRQESQYEMTGLYSETQDDSSADLPQDPGTLLSRAVEPQSVTVSTTLTNPAVTTTCITSSLPDTVIKCHSRQPSASLMDREKTFHTSEPAIDELSRDCGILSCRPVQIQKLARIKVSWAKVLHPEISIFDFFIH
jgi:organic anion transporter 3A